MKTKLINFSHLKKYLTCQPYFVWHSLDKTVNEEQALHQAWNEDKPLSFELPSFGPLDTSLNAEDQAIIYDHPLSAIQHQSIDIINRHFLKFVQKQFKNLQIVPHQSRVSKAAMSREYIEKFPNATLYNPTFIYDFETYQAQANPQIYDLKTHSVYFLKMSLNTRRSDIIKLYFDVALMRKLGLKVKNVFLYILATKQYQKGEIDFYLTKTLNVQKSGTSFKDKGVSNYYEMAQLSKVGLNSQSWLDINETINSQTINNTFLLKDLDDYLRDIIYARQYDTLEPISSDDQQFFDECYVPWKTIVSLTNEQSFQNFHGALLKKSDLTAQSSWQELINKLIHERPLLKTILQHPHQIMIDHLKVATILKDIDQTLVVWYDFEAFSLPIAPLDNFLPFSQVVSQVSVIKTNGLIETSVVNVVLDPLLIKLTDMIKIVDAIYDPNAQYYVVYNKTYEHSRLKEMITKLQESNIECQELAHKVELIIQRTIDLADLFKISNSKQKPPFLITDLKGMYSIKKLEDYITNNYPQFKNQIKSYKSLKINNGLYAMEIANQRALGIIGNQEWKIKTQYLAQYCENDVRAMIMVYKFVIQQVKQQVTQQFDK